LALKSPYQWFQIENAPRTSVPVLTGPGSDSIPVSRIEPKHSLVAKSHVEALPVTRVLIIDDDDVARELLSSTLKQAGYQVIELASAIGATRAIFEHNVDAVVVDVMLPDISGDKLARVLRENSRGQSLGIVLVSSRPVQELQELAAGARADGVVAKANVRSGLVATVTRAVERRSRRVAAPR
jgi:DNA-binding response OmpR family regulator